MGLRPCGTVHAVNDTIMRPLTLVYAPYDPIMRHVTLPMGHTDDTIHLAQQLTIGKKNDRILPPSTHPEPDPVERVRSRLVVVARGELTNEMRRELVDVNPAQ